MYVLLRGPPPDKLIAPHVVTLPVYESFDLNSSWICLVCVLPKELPLILIV